MLGTEDGESLRDRIDWYSFASAKDYPISYLADGIELTIDYIPPIRILTSILCSPTIARTTATMPLGSRSMFLTR